MKIKFFALIATVTFLVGIVTCNAAPRLKEIPVADIAIGGITIGADESYVRSIYGEPTDISYESNRCRAGPIHTKTFTYEKTFIIVFDTENHKVFEVKSTGNNGLKTPAGFTVGMKLSDVLEHYGFGRGDENYLAYNANWWYNIGFTAKNGKITEIHIYLTP